MWSKNRILNQIHERNVLADRQTDRQTYIQNDPLCLHPTSKGRHERLPKNEEENGGADRSREIRARYDARIDVIAFLRPADEFGFLSCGHGKERETDNRPFLA